MDKYIPIAGYSDGWSTTARETITILEDDPQPIATGLLDARGVKLYRVKKHQPIGFPTGSKMEVVR